MAAAAEREIFEETGLVVQAHAPVTIFEVIERDARGSVRYHYVIVDLAADYISGEIRPGDDALEARWISEEELALLPVNPKTREVLKKYYAFGL
jgi:ADP-ribose pyrophosphatase